MSAPSVALADFVTYVGKHLTGDEKGEVADFLDHFFRALGHEGVKQAGATRETRVAKKGGAKARCSTWKSDFNYTGTTVFDSFPWPQSPTRKQIEAVAKEAVALRQLRREVIAKMDWSLRDLYRTLEEPGANPLRSAQANLDTAVRAAYGMPKSADILAFLLALNQICAGEEAAGEPITPPGLPLPVKEHGKFITEDCIRL